MTELKRSQISVITDSRAIEVTVGRLTAVRLWPTVHTSNRFRRHYYYYYAAFNAPYVGHKMTNRRRIQHVVSSIQFR